jgi:hypothetical protein
VQQNWPLVLPANEYTGPGRNPEAAHLPDHLFHPDCKFAREQVEIERLAEVLLDGLSDGADVVDDWLGVRKREGTFLTKEGHTSENWVAIKRR